VNQLALIRECFPGAEIKPPDLSLQIEVGANNGHAPDVISHVGLYWRTLRFRDIEVPVAGIGAVCTDPAHRREGHASHLLEAAHALAVGRGVTMAALFSDLDDFYEPHGYLGTNVPTLLVAQLVGWAYGGPRVDYQTVEDGGERW
jgi:GNAT superfamily N-acetyltransferase